MRGTSASGQGMIVKITDIPAAKLIEAIQATERSGDPDRYALRVLWDELSRRLDAIPQNPSERKFDG
jgi:hypothetical protein